jgi:hypothetical protein
MTPIMPEGTKCARCDEPIKNFEPFVVSRFGKEVQFLHKRPCIMEPYRGKFLPEHVLAPILGRPN